METSELYFRLTTSLLMVLGLIILGTWLLRFIKNRQIPWSPLIKRFRIVEKLRLDEKRSLVIIDLDAREYVFFLGQNHEMLLNDSLSTFSPSAALVKPISKGNIINDNQR